MQQALNASQPPQIVIEMLTELEAWEQKALQASRHDHSQTVLSLTMEAATAPEAREPSSPLGYHDILRKYAAPELVQDAKLELSEPPRFQLSKETLERVAYGKDECEVVTLYMPRRGDRYERHYFFEFHKESGWKLTRTFQRSLWEESWL